jgi:nicotinamidase-related amidase
MECVGATAAGAQAATLLASFREQRRPVIHVQHLSVRPGATFFVPGTPGAEIHASVRPVGDEPVFKKHFPNAFRETALLEHLRLSKISALVIAGMMTHMCIDATTRAAADLGLRCFLAHDACATRALSFGDTRVPAEHVQCSFVSALSGTYATVQPAKELAGALAG